VAADEATLIAELLPRLNQLLGSAFPSPLWLDRQGWKYALPNGKADHIILESYEQSDGLYFTGDALAGLGRIHLAMEHGMTIAQRIIAHH
jgi:predicted NAD/FAD-dependent oxidoreductase